MPVSSSRGAHVLASDTLPLRGASRCDVLTLQRCYVHVLVRVDKLSFKCGTLWEHDTLSATSANFGTLSVAGLLM